MTAPAVAATQLDAAEYLDDAAVIEWSWSEPERFAVLYDRHAAEIHRYIARRLGDDAADDVLAEVFLAAFRRRRRYDTARAGARPWLYGIAGNLIAGHRRAEVAQYRLWARTGADPSAVGFDEGADGRVDASAVSARLAAAVGGLSKRDREVLLLIAWQGLSYDEVAVALGIPTGTVRSRLHRARKKVRAVFGGVDPTAVHEEVVHG